MVTPRDPELDLVWAVPGVAFGHPGTDVGEAGVIERDKVAADHDGGTIAAGSYQLADGIAEITGVGVLPASRRRGLGAAVTHALALDALARGARTVFLSATDATVARVYARLGFREIGTAMIAEPALG